MNDFSGMMAVAYLRWSHDEQADSMAQQEAVLKRWAQQRNVTIFDWITKDHGISGTLREDRRPGLRRLLSMIRFRTDFQLILCYDLSRFGRFQDPNTYSYYFQIAHDHQKTFVFTQDDATSKDTDISKVIQRAMSAHSAAEKSRTTAVGAIRGQVARAERGRCVGGFPPYGFDHLVINRDGNPEEVHRFMHRGPRGMNRRSTWHILNLDRTLIKVTDGPPPKQKEHEVVLVPGEPERVNVVNRIFEMYVNDRMGFKRIARMLNRLEKPSPLGGKWTWQTVRGVLVNPAYRGFAVFNRRTSAKIYRIKKQADALGNSYTHIVQEDREREKVRMNAEQDWFIYPNKYGSPVPKDLADRAYELLKVAGKAKGGTGTETFGTNPRASRSIALLAGYIICMRCGKHFRADPWQVKKTDPTTGRLEKRYNYICASYLDSGPEACPKCVVRRETVEKPVMDRIRDRFLGSATENNWKAETREILAEVYGMGVDAGKRDELKKKRQALEEQGVFMVRSVKPGNESFVNLALAKIKDEIQAVDREIEELSRSIQPEIDLDRTVDEIWGLVADFRENFETADPTERKRILRPFVRGISVYPDRREMTVDLYRVPMPEGMESTPERTIPPRGFEPRSSD